MIFAPLDHFTGQKYLPIHSVLEQSISAAIHTPTVLEDFPDSVATLLRTNISMDPLFTSRAFPQLFSHQQFLKISPDSVATLPHTDVSIDPLLILSATRHTYSYQWPLDQP